MRTPCRPQMLACYALSQSALPLAQRLINGLQRHPWPIPGAALPAEGMHGGATLLAHAELFAPARFCPAGASAFEKIRPLLAATYTKFAAHAFIGATGIAVRAIAPLLVHKSADAPVLVLDPAGQHVISLLSGHWGGANELARHVADLLGATAVITTASDAAASAACGEADNRNAQATPTALDLLLRNAGLPPVDWNNLPAAQAAMLEGTPLHLWDPCAAVPDHPGLLRLPCATDADTPPCPDGLLVAAHWRRLPPGPGTVRVAVPRLVLGLGCRKNAPTVLVHTAVRNLLARHGLEPLALAGLATVAEKLHEPALRALAESLHLPLQGFDAADLARCSTPNPSVAAGKRFNQPPFSVCEAAALLAAARLFPAGSPSLLVPKTIEQGQLTMAVALSDRITE